MSTESTAHLIYGVKVEADIREKAELDLDIPEGLEPILVGALCVGEELAHFITILDHVACEYGNICQPLGLEDFAPEPLVVRKLIAYVKSLGVEDPVAGWYLAIEVG